jgi:hypothetical protein
MKYLYWVSVVIVVIIGVGLSVYFGQETTSIPKIQYSHFSDSGKFAETLITEMGPELQAASIVMLGVTPGRKIDLEVWKAFLEQTGQGSLKYQVLIVDPDLPLAGEMFPEAIKVDLKTEMARFMEGMQKAQAQQVRMAVIVPSIYASQLLQGNPVDLFKNNSGLKPLSLSILGFPRTPEQEATMETQCVMGQNDREGDGALICAVQKKSRLLYRKKSKPGFYEGVVDQVGDRDFLILFNAP